MNYTPVPATRLSGAEVFAGVDASVLDFWKFTMGDLRTNNVRGYLAEFLVARAVGAQANRVEWEAWDITAPDGTRIEVKSSGYLQSWIQTALSVPQFTVKPARGWDSGTNTSSAEPTFHAHVYVFCLHTATTHEEYDPLQMSQWRFYVASRAAIEARTGLSMRLSTLTKVAGEPVTYTDLGAAIAAAASVPVTG